jgi:hypothetical protein
MATHYWRQIFTILTLIALLQATNSFVADQRTEEIILKQDVPVITKIPKGKNAYIENQGPDIVRVRYMHPTSDRAKSFEEDSFYCGVYVMCPLKNNSDFGHMSEKAKGEDLLIELAIYVGSATVGVWTANDGQVITSETELRVDFSSGTTFDYVVSFADKDQKFFDDMKKDGRYQIWALTEDNFTFFPDKLNLDMHVNLGDTYDGDKKMPMFVVNDSLVTTISRSDKKLWCETPDCKYHVRMIGVGYSDVSIRFGFVPALTIMDCRRGYAL